MGYAPPLPRISSWHPVNIICSINSALITHSLKKNSDKSYHCSDEGGNHAADPRAYAAGSNSDVPHDGREDLAAVEVDRGKGYGHAGDADRGQADPQRWIARRHYQEQRDTGQGAAAHQDAQPREARYQAEDDQRARQLDRRCG